MNTYKTEPARYTPDDFILWTESGLLLLSPKFQRRSVWRMPAKSYLIDTILREMIVPPLYIRMTQDEARTRWVREVVDGQQRVRTVLEFIADDFRLAKTVRKSAWDGKRFSQLKPDEQSRIKSYRFSVEIFPGISDQEVLEVFCRLNVNGIALNKQELRNGKYFGLFKQASYDVAYEHLEFWLKNKIFNNQSIARMLEVELTSELLVAAVRGMQDKKTSLNKFYEDHEDDYPSYARDVRNFREVISVLAASLNGDLATSEFHRPPLFYSLYCVVYHRMFGLPAIQRQSPKRKLTADNRESLREAVIKLSDILSQSKQDSSFKVPAKYVAFVDACKQQTDNILPRKARFDCLYGEAF